VTHQKAAWPITSGLSKTSVALSHTGAWRLGRPRTHFILRPGLHPRPEHILAKTTVEACNPGLLAPESRRTRLLSYCGRRSVAGGMRARQCSYFPHKSWNRCLGPDSQNVTCTFPPFSLGLGLSNAICPFGGPAALEGGISGRLLRNGTAAIAPLGRRHSLKVGHRGSQASRAGSVPCGIAIG
jgi:hypothetical protein